MKSYRWRFIAAVIAGVTLIACERGPTEPKPDGTQVVFRNMGTLAIVSAGASECEDLREWPNNLKSPLQPGAEVSIEIYKGCWDLQAKFSDGREKIQWAVNMTKGQKYTWGIN